MKHIGLYFGSFNPIHVGHIQVARYIQDHGNFDEIWFVPSPLNPHKSEETLVPADIRLAWVKKAITPESGFLCCDIEYGLGLPSYTHRTVEHLIDAHPDLSFSMIMGADNLLGFHKWQNANHLSEICSLHVYARPNYQKPNGKLPFGATWYDAPLLHISATQIRDLLANHESIAALVPASILNDVETFFQHFFSEVNQ